MFEQQHAVEMRTPLTARLRPRGVVPIHQKRILLADSENHEMCVFSMLSGEAQHKSIDFIQPGMRL